MHDGAVHVQGGLGSLRGKRGMRDSKVLVYSRGIERGILFETVNSTRTLARSAADDVFVMEKSLISTSSELMIFTLFASPT